MKRLIDYFVSGMRTASFFYLSMMVLTQFYPGITYPEPMIKNILALFLMGGIMGVLTLILEKLEFLAFSIRVGVHLLVTATILVLTSLFFGWGSALWSPFLLSHSSQNLSKVYILIYSACQALTHIQ